MRRAMHDACTTHMPDAMHERTNELTNADLASKTEISGSAGNARGLENVGQTVWRLAYNGTDPAWSVATDNCGGCGNADCHPRQPCPGTHYCLVCPHRREQGVTR